MKIDTLKRLVESKSYQVGVAKKRLKQRLTEWADAKAELELMLLQQRAVVRSTVKKAEK